MRGPLSQKKRQLYAYRKLGSDALLHRTVDNASNHVDFCRVKLQQRLSGICRQGQPSKQQVRVQQCLQRHQPYLSTCLEEAAYLAKA